MAIMACIDDLKNQTIWNVQEFGHTDHNLTKWLAFEYANKESLLVIEYNYNGLTALTSIPCFLESKVILQWEFGMPEELIDLFLYYTPI